MSVVKRRLFETLSPALLLVQNLAHSTPLKLPRGFLALAHHHTSDTPSEPRPGLPNLTFRLLAKWATFI